MTAPQTSRPESEITREVRFAIVMYGGVSLAIYLNGVTQELLRLVRATAPDPDHRERLLVRDEDLESTELIYRRIARAIHSNGDWSIDAIAPDAPTTPIVARFVIDILSGTSAGGINAIFLAKAMALGQNIDALASLWVKEGAIEQLVNDRKSKFDSRAIDPEPTSLLNSRRMYRKLVDAFDDMERAGKNTKPLVSDVDLFITTTDIRGLPVALRLADSVVAELRHRNVFHFRFADGRNSPQRNDFVEENNPFLAFSARCTSSFPFAFEPMTLADIDDVLARRNGRSVPSQVQDDGQPWRQFFPAYTGGADGDESITEAGALEASARGAIPWLANREMSIANVAFGDGGYLDNKPFSYAIGALAGRRASLPVDRKLLFLEPDPVIPEMGEGTRERPNALENVQAAMAVARYETIREDLQRVLAHNRLVERVGRIVSGIDVDLSVVQSGSKDVLVAGPEAGFVQYEDGDVDAMLKRYGIAYGGYHRLKVSGLTDELAEYVSRAAGFNESSDEFEAVRLIVGAWRSRWYRARFLDGAPQSDLPYSERDTSPGRLVQTENVFLLQFDLSFRIRRLRFLLGRIDQLVPLDERASATLKHRGLRLPDSDEEKQAFAQRLRDLCDIAGKVLSSLRMLQQKLLAREASVNPICEMVQKLKISRQEMLTVLAPVTSDLRRKAAARLVETRDLNERMCELARGIDELVRKTTSDAAKLMVEQLKPPPIANPDDRDGRAIANAIMRAYYWEYERYDQLIFPAFFSTDVGEEAQIVDVLRVSSHDAPSLIDETRITETRRKLAGTGLGHFGAFMDKRWRWNDIMWGRLDGAERLLMALLPNDSEEHQRARSALIAEAHGIILDEELRKTDSKGAYEWATPGDQKVIAQLLAQPTTNRPDAERVELRKRVREIFARDYSVSPDLDAQPTAAVAARATRVIGGMLRRMTSDYEVTEKPGVWLTRIGSIAWGLVEVATPGSIAGLAFRHFVTLAYVIAIVLFVVGAFVNADLRSIGLWIGGVTLTTQLGAAVLGDLFRKRTTWMRRVAIVLSLAILGALFLGTMTLVDQGMRTELARRLGSGRAFRPLLSALMIAVGSCVVLALTLYIDARARARKRLEVSVDKLQDAVDTAWHHVETITRRAKDANIDLQVTYENPERRKIGWIMNPFDRRSSQGAESPLSTKATDKAAKRQDG